MLELFMLVLGSGGGGKDGSCIDVVEDICDVQREPCAQWHK